MVLGPYGSARASGHVSTNHKFYREGLTFLGEGDIGVRNGNDMILNDVLGLLEPPGTGLIKHLSFKGNGSKYAIESRLPVGGDQGIPIAQIVAVSYFSMIFLKAIEIGIFQTIRKIFGNNFPIVMKGGEGVDHVSLLNPQR